MRLRLRLRPGSFESKAGPHLKIVKRRLVLFCSVLFCSPFSVFKRKALLKERAKDFLSEQAAT
jgi:hypothetical protein